MVDGETVFSDVKEPVYTGEEESTANNIAENDGQQITIEPITKRSSVNIL